jgi:thioredoxin reductase
LPFAGLFTATKVTPASTPPAQAGWAIVEGPMGEMISVDGSKRTSVLGIFACGDGALTGLHLQSLACLG